MKQEVLYSALALAHAKNKGGEMLNDFTSMLTNSGETHTVDQLLSMSVNSFLRTNANENMTTQMVGFGKEFVEEVVLSAELIERLKDSDSLLADFIIKQMNARKIDIPVRGARVRMISTTELADQPIGTAPTGQAKKAGTAKITLEAHTVVVTIYYSDELLEDSVIGMAQYVLGEIYTAYENTLHDLVLNGDTETGASANVNIIDGAVASLADGVKNSVLLADGLRKTAISRAAIVDA
jgi:HK97 family phage major capsid protein